MSAEPTLRVAVVTGASRGLGLAITRQLAQDGFRVYAADLLRDGLERTCVELSAEGLQVLPLVLDVSSEEQVAGLPRALGSDYEHLACLVNNAGVSGRDQNGRKISILDLDLASWEKTMTVNVTGAFLLSRVCLPPMIGRKWGRVVNISSMRGRTASSEVTTISYPTSKAALLGFTRSLAREVGEHGITVNAVCPGRIESAMNQGSSHASFQSKAALGVAGQPTDVASMVGYLAGEGGRFITGASLDVNGGAWMG